MESLCNNKCFVEYNAQLTRFGFGSKGYSTFPNGKIRTICTACPKCGSSNFVDNGYHNVESFLIQTLGLDIKIAQFCCKKCGNYWSANRDFIDDVIQKEKEFVKTLLLGCARKKLSLQNACTVVDETVGHSYSPQYLNELYIGVLNQIKDERVQHASGVYNYDEQYLKENGKEVCRLTIRDQVTGEIILDKMSVDAKETSIRTAMQEALNGLPVEAFTVDMAAIYPKIIHELFPQAKIQWCIFHLHKLIWKDLKDEFGKNPPLIQVYNVYLLFNIFYDHSIEIRKLEELLKQTTSTKSENSLLKEFRDFVKALKKQRRRENQQIPRRTEIESKNIFDSIKQQTQLFSKKLQNRIKIIDDKWTYFTLFQKDIRIQPTNNGIEQYFAATLAKTEKKKFRNTNAITRELRTCRAEWNNQKIFSTTNLLEIIQLIGLLFLAFPPT
jgi:hypothetical protein